MIIRVVLFIILVVALLYPRYYVSFFNLIKTEFASYVSKSTHVIDVPTFENVSSMRLTVSGFFEQHDFYPNNELDKDQIKRILKDLNDATVPAKQGKNVHPQINRPTFLTITLKNGKQCSVYIACENIPNGYATITGQLIYTNTLGERTVIQAPELFNLMLPSPQSS